MFFIGGVLFLFNRRLGWVCVFIVIRILIESYFRFFRNIFLIYRFGIIIVVGLCVGWMG